MTAVASVTVLVSVSWFEGPDLWQTGLGPRVVVAQKVSCSWSSRGKLCPYLGICLAEVSQY